MNVIPFKSEHISAIQLQPHQAQLVSNVTLAYLDQLGKLGPAISGEVDGKIIGSAGIVVQGFGVGTLWAFIAGDSGRHFVRMDRCARRLLTIPKLRRIEATAEVAFPQGCRWLELLGFQCEGVMRKYGPHGEDHRLYART